MKYRKPGRFCLHVSVATGALLAFAHPVPVLAQAQTFQFDIPAQGLASALRAVARTSRQQVTFQDRAVRGKHAPAVKGSYTARAALDQILAGTGLGVTAARSGLFIIRETAAPPVQTASREVKVAPPVAASETQDDASADPGIAPVDEGGEAGEIVVTGTRVARDGYQAPTPLTVVSEQQIETAARDNIADMVNTLPSVAGSLNPRNSQGAIGLGTAGINAINLRGLGSNRTLILLDGQRSVAASSSGLVDINDFPQALISRVEVVTGGASAAYGSDALSGVVNFILDRKYTGLKGSVSSGITTYGDDHSWQASLTGGLSFAGGRGHVVVSGEISRVAGTGGVGRDREWNNRGWQIINNPSYTATNGQPERLLLPQIGLSRATLGGIIVNTALKGTAFGPGGTPYQFAYGPLVSGASMQGGDWASTQVNDVQSLDPKMGRESIFARFSYEIVPDVEVFGQVSISHSNVVSACCRVFNVGNIIVQSNNAFLPQSVADRAAGLGITQFTLGTMNPDLPVLGTDNDRTARRYVIGAEGRVDILGTRWKWDGYYQRGESKLTLRSPNNLNKANFSRAIDAVRDPTNGNIVCRSTLADPGNGCIPYNLFGSGVNSPGAIEYLTGTSFRRETLTQDVVAATVTGEPLSTWAGPVSLAFGAEHRSESVKGEVDPIGGANGYFVGNYLPTFGSYKVTEGFVETVIPLLRDVPMASELDLNGAVRLTDYSTSGLVTTWKVGATYVPVKGVMFRATRSRDIRAPNLLELFNAGGLNQNTVIDPFNNNALTSYQGLATGNPLLEPERADTLGLGMVLQPRFLPGFSASIDYFNIKIDGAISSVSAQSVVDRCFAGDQVFCSAITRGVVNGANVITSIRLQPFNFVQQIARGIDMQLDYRTPVDAIVSGASGDLSFSLLATHYLKSFSNNGVDAPTDQAGSNFAAFGAPDWIYRATLTYATDRTTMSLTGRGVSAGVYDTSFIECTSGCPTSTIANRTINDNKIAGAFYVDAYLARKIEAFGGDAELFLNVVNLFNKDPAVAAPGPSGSPFTFPAANATYYDVLGRVFRVGLRFEM